MKGLISVLLISIYMYIYGLFFSTDHIAHCVGMAFFLKAL